MWSYATPSFRATVAGFLIPRVVASSDWGMSLMLHYMHVTEKNKDDWKSADLKFFIEIDQDDGCHHSVFLFGPAPPEPFP